MLPDAEWLTILAEEFGEVARAMQEKTPVEEELVQVAAVTVAWMECVLRRKEDMTTTTLTTSEAMLHRIAKLTMTKVFIDHMCTTPFCLNEPTVVLTAGDGADYQLCGECHDKYEKLRKENASASQSPNTPNV